jgi:hypothetical protein
MKAGVFLPIPLPLFFTTLLPFPFFDSSLRDHLPLLDFHPTHPDIKNVLL